MRLLRLHLEAFGPFTDRMLEFGTGSQNLVLVHGPNEAGKSSALRAISDLRFGIPQLSSDNFVHAHPEMRVGGVFRDRQGREYALTRRKGRGATLSFARSSACGASVGGDVPAEVELLLTCGLARDEYDKGFGIDHARLREGGTALLAGKGEIGAALFEASAGVRSLSHLLDRLDDSARRFFIPGPRGKNAPINEALRSHAEHHAALRSMTVRPARWAELFRKHQAALQELGELEATRAGLNARLLLIRELRAVEPLLRSLDHASQVVHELAEVPMLAPTAATERAAAVSGLAGARGAAQAAAAEAARLRERLAGLEPDAAILGLAAAIRRLAASAEAIDRHRAELRDARVELDGETGRVAELAARIDARAGADDVLARAPTRAARAGIDRLLHEVERTQQALEQHRAALAQQASEARGTDDDGDEAALAPPPRELRIALHSEQSRVAASAALLERLAVLPGEIESARRRRDAALRALGLADEAALTHVRPLLDSRIDAAMDRQRDTRTRRHEREQRIDAITKALREETSRHERLLEHGELPTPDEVRKARGHRDRAWALVRAVHVEGNPSAAQTAQAASLGAGRSLALAYEEAVVDADRLVDALARDSERAAQLQACRNQIGLLERDRAGLRHELEGIAREEAGHDAAWREQLAAAGLPILSPAELREWQAMLPTARAACETLQARLDELDQARSGERRLSDALHAAIVATGLAFPAGDASLDTLRACAGEVENEIAQREKRLHTAAGRRQQNERHRQQLAEQAARAQQAAHDAREALAPALGALLLAGDAGTAVARARLAEFDDLLAAHERRRAAETRLRKAAEDWTALIDAAAELAGRLGDPVPPDDARRYGEWLLARLESAERIQKEQALARQALDSALDSQLRHEAAAATHERILAGLCVAAGVASPDQLPEAEARAQRKREAQEAVDRSASQLARASRRSLDELRELLRGLDTARMDADEAACQNEQLQLDGRLREARQDEEAARRELEAIDGADAAAAEREAMERAAARIRANVGPWLRSRLAHALLAEAARRFRERAQAPVLESASRHFERMTAGRFQRLDSDDDAEGRPVLVARRGDGARLRVEALSEGTLDQLFLALRLAALELHRAAGVDLPVVLDDILMTSDDHRALSVLQSLSEFARDGQVIVFTHHEHVAELARRGLPEEMLAVVTL